MRPSPDGEHVSSEELAMEGKPGEEFAFRLRVSGPNFLGLELGETPIKLCMIGGGSTVCAVGRERPSDGILCGQIILAS